MAKADTEESAGTVEEANKSDWWKNWQGEWCNGERMFVAICTPARDPLVPPELLAQYQREMAKRTTTTTTVPLPELHDNFKPPGLEVMKRYGDQLPIQAPKSNFEGEYMARCSS